MRSNHRQVPTRDYGVSKQDSTLNGAAPPQRNTDLKESLKQEPRAESRPENRLNFHRDNQIDSRRQKHSAPHRVPKPAFNLGAPIHGYSSRFTANNDHLPLGPGSSGRPQLAVTASTSFSVDERPENIGVSKAATQDKAAPLYKSFFSDDRRRKAGVKPGRDHNRDASSKQVNPPHSSREVGYHHRTNNKIDAHLKLAHASLELNSGRRSRDRGTKPSNTEHSSHDSGHAMYGRRSASPNFHRQSGRSRSPDPLRQRRLSSSDQYHKPSRTDSLLSFPQDNSRPTIENQSSTSADGELKILPSLAPAEIRQEGNKTHFDSIDSSMLEAFGPEAVPTSTKPVSQNLQIPRTSFAEYLKRSKLTIPPNPNVVGDIPTGSKLNAPVKSDGTIESLSESKHAHPQAQNRRVSETNADSAHLENGSGDGEATFEGKMRTTPDSSTFASGARDSSPPPAAEPSMKNDAYVSARSASPKNMEASICSKPVSSSDILESTPILGREGSFNDANKSLLKPSKTGSPSISRGTIEDLDSKGRALDSPASCDALHNGIDLQLNKQVSLKSEPTKHIEETEEPQEPQEPEEVDIAPINAPRTPQPALTTDDSDHIHLSPHASEWSMLSPIHDNADEVDFNFNDLATIKESIDSQLLEVDSDNEEFADDMSGVSEAETIVGEFPEPLSLGSALARKNGRDVARHRLKRRSAVSPRASSDDEELQPRRSRRSNPVLLQASSDEEEFLPKHSGKRVGSSSAQVPSDESGPNSDAGRSLPDSIEPDALPLLKQPYKMRRNAGGVSLLQRACKRGDIEDARNFLDRGASANEKDFCGFTCLHEAALKGHLDIVKLLIERDAQVNAKSDEAGHSETALFDAAENKHVDVVRFLLEAGADPSVTNLQGLTALTKIFLAHADEDGYTKIVALLRNDEFAYKNRSESTSASSGLLDPVDDPNEEYFQSLTKKKGILRFAASGAKEITANYFVAGNTLSQKPDMLFLAARNGHAELLDIILGLDPGSFDIDTENSVGCTVLIASVGRGHYEVVESLLAKNADPRMCRNGDGLNALEIAQRSVEYDPREVALIREHMELRGVATGTHDSEAIKDEHPEISLEKDTGSHDPEAPKHRLSEDLTVDSQKAKRLKASVVDSKFSKNTSIENPPPIVSPEPHTKRESSSSEDAKIEDEIQDSPEPLAQLRSLDEQEADVQYDLPVVHGHELSPTADEPQLASDKSQDEHHRAEEARIWQQKVEAKKQARRETFIKTEREKERKRKHEEEVLAAEQERLAEEAEKLRSEAEQLAREQAQAIAAQRQVLRRELVVASYPVGLRSFKVGAVPTKTELARFAPIYVFGISGVNCVVDLQLVLMTGQTQAELLRQNVFEKVESLDLAAKSKVWQLFEPMINDAHGDSSPADHTLFQNLDINFVKLELVELYVKLNFPELEQMVWTEKRITRVDMGSLRPCTSLERSIQSLDPTATQFSKNFVPPKLQTRKDAVSSIECNSRTIW